MVQNKNVYIETAERKMGLLGKRSNKATVHVVNGFTACQTVLLMDQQFGGKEVFTERLDSCFLLFQTILICGGLGDNERKRRVNRVTIDEFSRGIGLRYDNHSFRPVLKSEVKNNCAQYFRLSYTSSPRQNHHQLTGFAPRC